MQSFAQLPGAMFPLSNECLCTGFAKREESFEIKSKLKGGKVSLLFLLQVLKQISNSLGELFVYFVTAVVLAPQAPETLPRLW